jgi:hypothetical protein
LNLAALKWQAKMSESSEAPSGGDGRSNHGDDYDSDGCFDCDICNVRYEWEDPPEDDGGRTAVQCESCMRWVHKECYECDCDEIADGFKCGRCGGPGCIECGAGRSLAPRKPRKRKKRTAVEKDRNLVIYYFSRLEVKTKSGVKTQHAAGLHRQLDVEWHGSDTMPEFSDFLATALLGLRDLSCAASDLDIWVLKRHDRMRAGMTERGPVASKEVTTCMTTPLIPVRGAGSHRNH